MILQNIMRSTAIVSSGMTIRDGFQACVEKSVPCVPFVDKDNVVIGNFSIRETLKKACLPEIFIEYADIIGSSTGCVEFPEQHAKQLLNQSVDDFIDVEFYSVPMDTDVAKMVALMEKHRVNYLFVIEQQKYMGEITIEAIARRMLELK